MKSRRTAPRRDLAGVYVYPRKGRRSTSWVVEYLDATGRRHRATFSTELEAQQAADERRRQAPGGGGLGLNTTANAYAERWLDFIRPPAVKPATWTVYESMWRVHWQPTLGSLPVRRIDSRLILGVLLERQRAGAAASSVTVILATLTGMLAAAVDDGLISTNPANGLKRRLKLPEAEPPNPMTPAQADRFRAGVARVAPDLALFFRLLEQTGLRHGEGLGLKWEDVDWFESSLAVRRTLTDPRRGKGPALVGTPKSGRSRSVRLPSELLDALRDHRAAAQRSELAAGVGRGEWIFGGTPGGPPPKQSVTRHVFDRALLAGGLASVFRVHDLRHTYAIRLLERGVDVRFVSKQLGHATPSFTLDRYGRWIPGAHERDLLDGVFGTAPLPRAVAIGDDVRPGVASPRVLPTNQPEGPPAFHIPEDFSGSLSVGQLTHL